MPNPDAYYIPATFDLESLPDCWQPYAHQIQEFCHILHHRRLQEQLSREDYVPLKAEYLRLELGKVGPKRDWAWSIIKPYVLAEVAETDNYYEVNQKSYGYRFRPKYRDDRMVCRKIPRVVQRKNLVPKLPVHKFLVNNLRRLQVTGDWEGADELTQAHCQRIADGDFHWNVKDQFGHRFHSNLTQMPRTVKNILAVDGFPLSEIDLANSQPLWAAFEIAKRKIAGCESYIELCSSGQFYDWFVRYGWTRERIKDEFRQSILFKRNGYNSPIKTQFTKDFPEVAAFWAKCKAKDPKTFAKLLQRAEAKFVIYTVVDTLRRMQPDMFVATIHDSILTTPDNLEVVKQVITEAAPIPLTMKVKTYGRED